MKEDTHRRKIQLVAGVTYTVSLPKKWILKNNLTDKGEITISEKSDGSLLISPQTKSQSEKIENFDLDVDSYKEDVSQILFALYYLGAQSISVFSKKEMPNELKSKVKNTVAYMAGTEIIYEDQMRMKITILLDKNKVNLNQIFFRTALLIKSSIDVLITEFSFDEINRNEEEVDRLYHLISKIILLAHSNTDILVSSKIENTYYLTSYLLIAKKLENMSDRLFNLALYFQENPSKIKETTKILKEVKKHLDSAMSYFMNKDKKSFTKTDQGELQKLADDVNKIKDLKIFREMEDIVRYVSDVEEELTNISFYTKLIKQNVL